MPANPARLNSAVLTLAALDWARTPATIIQRELKCTHSHLTVLRQYPLYKETVQEIQESWKEKLLNRPETSEVAKTISYGLSIAVKKLVHLVADPQTSNKDIIGAARLLAQMDGRFLGRTEDGTHEVRGDNSIASELIEIMQRAKSSVQ